LGSTLPGWSVSTVPVSPRAVFFLYQRFLTGVRHFGINPLDNLIRQFPGFSPECFYDADSQFSFGMGCLELPRF
jgi:hypothetical protein